MKPPYGLPPREDAEALGLAALVFLTEDHARLSRFLTDTGLSPSELGQSADRRETLVAVLEHLTGDESMLLVFAAGAGVDPASVEPARMVLAGEAPSELHGGGPAPAHATKASSKRWSGPGSAKA